MILRELLTKIGFDIDNKSLDTFNKSIRSAQSSLFTIGVAVTAAAGSIFALVKNVSDVGDEINKSSEELGISTNALQEWRYAADQAGISNEELATGIRMFSRNIGDAVSTGTGPFVDRMAQLGVAITDANGKLKDNDTLLLEVADSLKNVKNASERGAIAQEFFGRSGLRMATFLSKGSAEVKLLRERAHELGLVLDSETVTSAEEFNDRLSDVFQVVKAIKNQVGAALIPFMKEAALTFLDWSMINRDLVKQNITEFFLKVTDVLKRLWEWGGRLSRGFEWFAKVCGGTENVLIALAGAFLLFKLAPLLAGVFALTRAMWGLFAGVLAVNGGVLLVPIGIALLITAIGMAISSILEFFGVIDEDSDYALQVWDMLTYAIYGVVAAIGVLVAIQIGKWIYAFANAAVVGAAAMWGMAGPWVVLIGLIGTFAYGLYKLWKLLGEVFADFSFMEKLKDAWMQFKTWIGNFFDGLTDWIGRKFNAFIDAIVSKVKWLTDKVKALNPFADDEPSARGDQSIDGQALAMNDKKRQKLPPLELTEDGYKNTRLGTIKNFFTQANKESQTMAAAPSVAPSQIYTAGNNTNTSNTVTNNRPVNLNSNINVNLPPGTSTIQQSDVTAAVKAAWDEELQKFIESGLFNNAEYE